jgi:hypothetical protein
MATQSKEFVTVLSQGSEDGGAARFDLLGRSAWPVVASLRLEAAGFEQPMTSRTLRSQQRSLPAARPQTRERA